MPRWAWCLCRKATGPEHAAWSHDKPGIFAIPETAPLRVFRRLEYFSRSRGFDSSVKDSKPNISGADAEMKGQKPAAAMFDMFVSKLMSSGWELNS